MGRRSNPAGFCGHPLCTFDCVRSHPTKAITELSESTKEAGLINEGSQHANRVKVKRLKDLSVKNISALKQSKHLIIELRGK